MKTSFIFALGGMLVLASAQSCIKTERANTNNPPSITTEARPYDITLSEACYGFDRDSIYIFHGSPLPGCSESGTVEFSSVNSCGRDCSFTPRRTALTCTPESVITLFSTEPVNASSSTECIDILRISEKEYTLRYARDGSSTISIWNGDKDSGHEFRILVAAASCIPLTGITLIIDGQEFPFLTQYSKFTWEDWGAAEPAGWIDYRFPLSCAPERLDNGKFVRANETVKIELFPEPINATAKGNTLKIDQDTIELVGHPTGNDRLYDWNLANNPEFRWFPANHSGNSMSPSFGAKINPSDLIARSAITYDYHICIAFKNIENNDYYEVVIPSIEMYDMHEHRSDFGY